MSQELHGVSVCMILMGGIVHDGRVRKEATSLKQFGCNVAVVTMPRAPEGQVGLRGVDIIEVLLKSRSLSLGAIGFILKYAEFVVRAAIAARKRKANVYHAHDLPALLPAYVASRITKGRLVYDAHELYTERGNVFSDNFFWRFLERVLIRRVDGILTTNESRARIIFEEYGAKVIPEPLYNCPFLTEPSSTETPLRDFVRRECPEVRRVILYQGAISEGRHCEELIAALPNLDEGVVVVFLGYSSPETYVETLKIYAQQLGVDGRVVFHPPVPNHLIVEHTRAADVGVVFYRATTRNNIYCASNKLFDYLMVGVPIVGSDIPGINEVMEGCTVGITVDASDAAEISAAVNQIISDEKLHRRMRENALQISRDRYCWEHQETTLRRFYTALA